MKKIILLFTVTLLASCSKDIEINEVFGGFYVDKTEIPADGKSTVELWVTLPQDASTDRRNIVFVTSSGQFSNASKTITVAAKYENGILTARTTLKAPFVPNDIKLTAGPEFDSPQGEFTQARIVKAVASAPATIALEPSAFGIAANHLSEVVITGLLRNAAGGPVSQGYKVRFEDRLMSGAAANGSFRSEQLTTADSSKVSAVYSAANLPVGTQIQITGYILDEMNHPILAPDTLILTVNQ